MIQAPIAPAEPSQVQPAKPKPKPPSEAVCSSILWDIFTETDDGAERDARVARFVDEDRGAEE